MSSVMKLPIFSVRVLKHIYPVNLSEKQEICLFKVFFLLYYIYFTIFSHVASKSYSEIDDV